MEVRSQSCIVHHGKLTQRESKKLRSDGFHSGKAHAIYVKKGGERGDGGCTNARVGRKNYDDTIRWRKNQSRLLSLTIHEKTLVKLDVKTHTIVHMGVLFKSSNLRNTCPYIGLESSGKHIGETYSILDQIHGRTCYGTRLIWTGKSQSNTGSSRRHDHTTRQIRHGLKYATYAGQTAINCRRIWEIE